MDLGITCICKRLEKCVPLVLMLIEIVSELEQDAFVVTIGLAVELRTICCSGEIFDTE